MKDAFLVAADATSPSFEALAFSASELARRLADEAGAELDLVVLGDGRAPANAWRNSFRMAPADGRYAATGVVGLIERHTYRAVLLAATPLSREIAGRLAGRLRLPLVAGTIDAHWREDEIEALRSVDGGRRTARLAVRPAPAVFILDPEAGAPGQKVSSVASHPVELQVQGRKAAVHAVGEEMLAPDEMDIAEAEVLIAGGRGVGGPEGFGQLEELAALLNGAVGASRVAVDLGWAPHSAQVGLTGRTVSPRLYVACGISGAIHHTLGMRDSGFIVAINKDANAPIFKLANVSIVGDVREVVAAIIKEIRARKGALENAEALLAAAR